MITSPARKISCRLTTTYAGFSGESVLLEDLHKRGMALPERLVRACVRATACCSRGTRAGCAVAGRAWLAEMRRSLRPSAYARMILNEFVSPESKFVDLDCVGRVRAAFAGPVLRDESLADLGWC